MRVQVDRAELNLGTLTSELGKLDTELKRVTAPNERSEPERLRKECRMQCDALALQLQQPVAASTAAGFPAAVGDLKEFLAALRSALAAVPVYARKQVQSGFYVPPPEFGQVLQHLTRGGGKAKSVFVHGAPGLGKSAMAREVENCYHKVCA